MQHGDARPQRVVEFLEPTPAQRAPVNASRRKIAPGIPERYCKVKIGRSSLSPLALVGVISCLHKNHEPELEFSTDWFKSAQHCPDRQALERAECRRPYGVVELTHSRYPSMPSFTGPGIALLRSNSVSCNAIEVSCTGLSLRGDRLQRGGECQVLVEMASPSATEMPSPFVEHPLRSSICKIEARDGRQALFYFHLVFRTSEHWDRDRRHFYPIGMGTDGAAAAMAPSR